MSPRCQIHLLTNPMMCAARARPNLLSYFMLAFTISTPPCLPFKSHMHSWVISPANQVCIHLLCDALSLYLWSDVRACHEQLRKHYVLCWERGAEIWDENLDVMFPEYGSFYAWLTMNNCLFCCVLAVQNERQPRNTATIRPEALMEMEQGRALREAAVAVGVFGWVRLLFCKFYINHINVVAWIP